MSENNLPSNNGKNIFQRLFDKIKSLFTSEEEQEKAIKTTPIEQSEFINNIKVDIPVDILDLRRKLYDGEINAVDLSDEEIEKLQVIFDEEIRQKEEQLVQLRKRWI